MSAPASRFALLMDLAASPSSDHRRSLLREVTDLFFETSDSRSLRESELFDEVLRTVASDMQDDVLVELGRRFCESPNPPTSLMRDLAQHKFPVAEQILRKCRSLTDEDLINVLRRQGQEHARAIAARETVSEVVSEVIVERGDDHTVDVLVRNSGAKISRNTMETVVDRARASAVLHEGLVLRPDLPLDLLNEMYFVVEQRLRSAILQRNEMVSPAELDAALEKARGRMQARMEDHSREADAARTLIRKKKADGQLDAPFLVHCLRDGKPNHFVIAFAEITGVEEEAVRQVLTRRDIDALAMMCRASDLPRPLFATVAMLVHGGERAMDLAEQFGKLYSAVPVEAAQRAMRFLKMRKTVGAAAA